MDRPEPVAIVCPQLIAPLCLTHPAQLSTVSPEALLLASLTLHWPGFGPPLCTLQLAL